MSFLRIKHRYDMGHDWYLQFLNTGRHVPQPFKYKSFLQASVSWNDYASWPFIQARSGGGSVFSFMIWVYKFGFDIGLIEHTWDWDRYKDDDENDVQ